MIDTRNRDMNKTAITLGYFGLGIVAVIGVILTAIIRPEATTEIIQFVGTIMAVASTGAVTFYMLGKQNEKVETIQKQTNGTLSALREENARLQQEKVEWLQRGDKE
jgi:BRCT domain type II-containing protein